MHKKNKSVFGKMWGACKKIMPGFKAEPDKNVKQLYSRNAENLSPQKQKKLEEMCEKLFEQQELISTGRLQLLGLSQIKKKLGKMWDGLRPIVYTEVEQAIDKYLMPKDIFIRYKDDSYVIVFAEAGIEESQIKVTLIAEEIKRRLFDHEEEELNNISVEESVSVFSSQDFKKGRTLSETVDIVFEKKAPKRPPEKPEKKQSVTLPTAIEVNPYTGKANTKEAQSIEKKHLNCTYMPLWDVKKNFLTVYLGLAQGNKTNGDPFDNHEIFFRGTTPSVKAKHDLEMLETITQDLAEVIDGGRKLFIACPVHYETLTRTESYEKYVLACQKIPKEHKKFLVLMLLNLPDKLHKTNIQKFSIPLKTHCSSFFAQVPLNPRIDFALIRECQFDAVGVRLKKANTSEKQVIETLNAFSNYAKKAFISKVFALDIASLSVTTSAVCADIDYLGGSAIHESVKKPNNIYHFMHQDLFSKILSDDKKE